MIFGFDILKPYVGGGGYEDNNGDWVATTGEWDAPIECDVEHPSGQANILNYEGGKSSNYSLTVTLNADVRSFAVGERVQITCCGESPQEYTVKGFRRYRTSAKLWV